MNLEKAIDILNLHAQAKTTLFQPNTQYALKLAIEAIKALQYMRSAEHPVPPALLPGETKE